MPGNEEQAGVILCRKYVLDITVCHMAPKERLRVFSVLVCSLILLSTIQYDILF